MKSVLMNIFLILWVSLASAQDLEEKLIEWLETTSRQEIAIRLNHVKQQYADSPAPLYLEAFIETNGNRALSLYKSLVTEYPDSRYSEYAMLRIGQYYFLNESYVSSRQWFENFIDRFPKSNHAAKAKYFSALCFWGSGENIKAEKELKKLIKNYPEDSFAALARQELNTMSTKSENNSVPLLKADENVSEGLDSYAVQIGAFSDQENALKLKHALYQKGYQSTVVTKFVSGQKLYLVWLGQFVTKNEAEKFGNQFQNQYGGSFRVVKK